MAARSESSDASNSSRSDRASNQEWSDRVSKAFEDAQRVTLSIVPDPALLVDNKLTRGILKAPKSLYKGTANALKLREPSSKRNSTSKRVSFSCEEEAAAKTSGRKRRPPNDSKASDTIDAISLSESSRESDASDASAASHVSDKSSAATDEQHPAAEIVPGHVYDFGFGTLLWEENPELALPRVVVRGAKKAIDDQRLQEVLDWMSAVIARNQPFSILYDVRSCSMPSGRQIKMGQKWGQANNKKLNRLLQGIAIIMSGVIVKSTVQMLLAICSPPQPCTLCGDDETALAFARDKCKEVRVWSKKKNKNGKRDSTAAACEATNPAQSAAKRATGDDGKALPAVAETMPEQQQVHRRIRSEPPPSHQTVGNIRVQMGALQSEGSGRPPNIDSGRAMMARLTSINDRKLAASINDRKLAQAVQADAERVRALQNATLPSASRTSRLIERLSPCSSICGREHRSPEREIPAIGAPPQLELKR